MGGGCREDKGSGADGYGLGVGGGRSSTWVARGDGSDGSRSGWGGCHVDGGSEAWMSSCDKGAGSSGGQGGGRASASSGDCTSSGDGSRWSSGCASGWRSGCRSGWGSGVERGWGGGQADSWHARSPPKWNSTGWQHGGWGRRADEEHLQLTASWDGRQQGRDSPSRHGLRADDATNTGQQRSASRNSSYGSPQGPVQVSSVNDTRPLREAAGEGDADPSPNLNLVSFHQIEPGIWARLSDEELVDKVSSLLARRQAHNKAWVGAPLPVVLGKHMLPREQAPCYCPAS